MRRKKFVAEIRHIQEVHASNLGPQTCHPVADSCCITISFEEISGILPRMCRRKLSSTHFSVHHSVVSLYFVIIIISVIRYTKMNI
jgi:hypothetical protein